MQPIKAILFEPGCIGDAQGTYEDVAPAFAELKAMGIQLLFSAAPLRSRFRSTTAAPVPVPNRDRKGAARDPDPAETLYVTDNAEGLARAKAAGMIPILLMHDPDEAMRLVANNPAGGIVSLLELPDFIRFVSSQPATPIPSPLLSVP
jgi:beta-phosphoglucomutase-like phosphatase (HAD superfamily)